MIQIVIVGLILAAVVIAAARGALKRGRSFSRSAACEQDCGCNSDGALGRLKRH
ncbi:MAG: hypothetical protein WBD22_13070 [Pyrinomonadaceae bacterium]